MALSILRSIIYSSLACFLLLASAQAAPSMVLNIQKEDHILGDPKAPVTIIEYASFSCSHCATFYKEVLPDVKKAYIDTGKAKLIYRDFPLNEPALRASQLARCAPKEKFYRFVEVLFATQNSWAFDPKYIEKLTNIGKLGGMNADTIGKCFTDTAIEAKILTMKAEAANALKINATPTFYINGTAYKGAHDPLYFSRAIEDALLKKQSTPLPKQTKTPSTRKH